jgi:hypothetical protein
MHHLIAPDTIFVPFDFHFDGVTAEPPDASETNFAILSDALAIFIFCPFEKFEKGSLGSER